jgi:hypothetical protein
MAKKATAKQDEGKAGYEKELAVYEKELAAYEKQLASYLQERIKPGLSRSAIPLMARSIAKEIARQEPPEQIAGTDTSNPEDGPVVDFEAEMHELQAELGEDWILRFSVHGEDGWLTAEKQDSSQRVNADTADQLLKIFDAMNSRGHRAADNDETRR